MILSPDANGIGQAGQLLRDGELVAFPTETVYGLGADAMNPAAVEAIFLAKRRPPDNPLIAHVADREMLLLLARDIPRQADQLINRFWPGALTLVLARKENVPAIMSAGLPSIAVRMPNHRVALDLIRQAGTPIAAPSANRSGRPSPTNARHVADEFGDDIAAIIDGGPCALGVESTVLDVTREPCRILRPGGVTREQLSEALGYDPGIATDMENGSSPGVRHMHYRPLCDIQLFSRDQPPLPGDQEGMITFTFPPPSSRFSVHLDSIEEYARRLYALMREADDRQLKRLYLEEPPEAGIGLALRDRLQRAARRE
ncbi:MAG: L-threonylcarbamoyladenylate synthase [Candidatus Hydrogenedentota bacterium]